MSAVGWLAGAVAMAAVPAAAMGAAPSRAYEMVSAVQKGSNEVNPLNTVQTSPDGARVLYSAPNGFPGAQASTAQSYYLAQRSPVQWQTSDIDPAIVNYRSLIFFTTTASSVDLGKSLQASNLPLTADSDPAGDNVYIRDNLSGARALAASGPDPLFDVFAAGGARPFGGGTPDFSTVLLQSSIRLTDDAIAGTGNVYEIRGGAAPRLLSLLPDDTADPFGSSSKAPAPVQANGAISDDGSRAIFNAGTTGALYLRENGVSTPISVSQRTGDPDTPQVGEFVSMTADGDHVFFLSYIPLTDEPTVNYSSLYRYDVADGRLTNLTATTDATINNNVTHVLAVTDSGSDAYFVSLAALAPGGVVNSPNLYHWSETDGTSLVAILDPVSEYLQPATWSMSESGRYFAFSSYASVTGYDNSAPSCRTTSDGNTDGVCSEVYRYDAETAAVSCASCDTEKPPMTHARLGEQAALISNYFSRRVLDDGEVFFNTGDALVTGDTNGRTDVYSYTDGEQSLISSGHSGSPSTFADASADGTSVFFFTAEPLVAQDVDQATDVYAARVGGGLAAQNETTVVASCLGDSCQGAVQNPPVMPDLGSVVFSGDGNARDDEVRPVTGTVKASTKKTVVGSAFTLSVKVPARGRIAISGRAVRSVGKSATRAATYRLKVRLTSKARKTLMKRRKLAVKVRVGYTPESGRTSAATVSVTLKAR